MSGPAATRGQIARYMDQRRRGRSQASAAAKADISERTGRRIEAGEHQSGLSRRRWWRTRSDPFTEVWQAEVEPRLRADPGLRAYALWEWLLQRHPDRWQPQQRRTLERRVAAWRLEQGPEREVMFPQEHPPGRMLIVDFTVADELAVTIAGQALPHRLGHARLAHSGVSSTTVVLGGESFTAVATTVERALSAIGGAPAVLRSDSLSAAFRNLGLRATQDLTARYAQLCAHYGMQPSRCNPGRSHENGSIESPNGHLKDRLDQALRLRGSRDFSDLAAYRAFVDETVAGWNAPKAAALAAERRHLRALPAHPPVTWSEAAAVVSALAMVRVLKVSYTVPSRLRGAVLAVRVYDDRVEFFRGAVRVHACPRCHRPGVSRIVDYRHVIDSLARKPGAFARLVYRDDLHPSAVYRAAWERLQTQSGEHDACRSYVRLLHAAHRYAAERRIEDALRTALAADAPIAVDALLAACSARPAAAAPDVQVRRVDLALYDALRVAAAHPDQDTA